MKATSSKQSVSAVTHATFFRLVDGVRLRREHFGGLVYEPTSGTTIELDKGAFRFAELAATVISTEEAPPKPRRTKAGADIVDEFASLLAPME